MRVLLVTLHFAPDSVSNAVVATELAEELSRHGHRVTVVCALPFHKAHRIEPGFGSHFLNVDRHGDIKVIRTWLYLRADKGDLGGRLASYASFTAISLIAGLITGRHDVIITPSPPLSLGIVGWLLAALWGGRFIYNVQDIYPDAAVKLGLIKNRFVIRFFSWLERFVYARAAAITVLSDGFRRNLAAKGVPLSKIEVIPNAVDVDFIRPLQRDNAFAASQRLVGRFVALYAGNVGLAQGVETVIDAAKHLSDPRVLIMIVGSGAGLQACVRRAEGLSNVRFLPSQPRASVPDLYASSDVGIVILRGGMGETSVPSKVYTVMAAGKAVLASIDKSSEVWDLVERVGCGLCVPPDDPRALVEAIERLSSDREGTAAMGARGRRYVVANHDRSSFGNKYDELLRRSPVGR